MQLRLVCNQAGQVTGVVLRLIALAFNPIRTAAQFVHLELPGEERRCGGRPGAAGGAEVGAGEALELGCWVQDRTVSSGSSLLESTLGGALLTCLLPTPRVRRCSKLWEELADVAHDNQDW